MKAKMMQSLLIARNLSKKFGGLIAVKNVSVEVGKGEFIAIIGPNGAGKTTLLNLISGFLKPDQGKVFLKGRDITNLSPNQRAVLGIGRTFQIPQPFRNLTVLENCIAAAFFGGKIKDNESAITYALDILKLVGLYDKKDELAGKLEVVDAKKLELARCLSQRSELLLLDESGAGLSSFEIDELVGILERISKEGVTIIMVEHIMSLIEKVAQRVLCMVNGEIISEGSLQKVLNDEKVIRSYLG